MEQQAATDLEQRLHAVESQLAITQLRAQYCHLLDARQWDAFASLFTEDGYFEGVDKAEGRDGIHRFFSQDVQLIAEHFWHFCSNGTCQIEGNRAHGRISMEYLSVTDGVSYISAGHYDDEFQRIDGQWKFHSRRITFYFYSPLEQGFLGPKPASAGR